MEGANRKITANSEKEMKCSSCVGMAYLSRSLTEANRPPRCFGLTQHKDDEIDLTGMREARPDSDFKYYCLGYSTYPTDGAASRSSTGAGLMPYCEGLEIAVLEDTTAETIESESKAGVSASSGRLKNSITARTESESAAAAWRSQAEGSSEQAAADPAAQSLKGKFMAKLADNFERVSSSLSRLGGASSSSGGEGNSSSSSSEGAGTASSNELVNKFLATAQQNVQRISSASSGMAGALYSTTLKPLIDIFTGGGD